MLPSQFNSEMDWFHERLIYTSKKSEYKQVIPSGVKGASFQYKSHTAALLSN